MEINEATPADAEVVAGIIREAFRDVADRFALTAENCPKHPSNCVAEWILRDLTRGVGYYSMQTGGNLAGCVALEIVDGDVAYLERLAVLPSHRTRGFGAALVGHALAQATAAGAHEVSVGIIAEHVELKAWYGRLGFVENSTKSFPHLPFRVAFLSRTLSGELRTTPK